MSYIDAFTIGTDGLFSTDSQQVAMQGLLGEDYTGTCGHSDVDPMTGSLLAAVSVTVTDGRAVYASTLGQRLVSTAEAYTRVSTISEQVAVASHVAATQSTLASVNVGAHSVSTEVVSDESASVPSADVGQTVRGTAHGVKC